MLAEAQSLYAESVNIILENEDYSSNELPELLMELVHSSYRNGHYDLGWRSLRYLLAYESTTSEDWLPRIEALIQLADWDLLHSSRLGTRLEDSAFANYEQAHTLLEEHGIARDSIEELFLAPIPLTLPSFLPNPIDSREQPDSRGYVEVSFVVTADGKGSQIEIVDTMGDTTRADERALARTIRRSRFRPRWSSSAPMDSAPVLVRYYLNE